MITRGKRIHKHYHGERVHTAKLTADDVLLIDALLTDGELSQREIARKFNVSHNAVWDIARGYSWKQVTGIGL